MSLPTTMRAQQWDPRDQKVHLNSIPVPTPGPKHLLVKIACASLCHSDLMTMEPNDVGMDLSATPTTIGHEAAGTVVGLGSEVSDFKVGDKVGFLPAFECCFECGPCREVTNLWCEKGTKMQGFSADGYFAEYAIVEARGAMVLPQGMDPVEAAPLFCAGVTAYHGVTDCGLKEGQWMAVIGCGGLGHLGIQYAKARGLKVIGIDLSDDQLEEAKACGADHVFNPSKNKDYAAEVLKLTGGGVAAAVNFTASARSYEDAPAILRPGKSILMVVGIPQAKLSFSAMDIAMRKFDIRGSNNGMSYNMREAIEFSAEHGVKAHLTLYPLEKLPEMIEIMHQGRTRGRLGVKFD
ncbi:GroES-like protein [Trichodelitschia bisporula]|uniref:GroES-like protein n=1 Tax=Trichodelitschia bisporula TaxID=703511 RepID=A0A6G1HIF6_9PEZI|nr:GroES-like protein [Trichodelitschia bisporula]